MKFVKVLALTALFCLPTAQGADLKAAQAEIQSGKAVLVDVREAAELKDGVVDHSLWLATSDIKAKNAHFTETLKALPKDKTIYTYCASGFRSGKFADDLNGQGYKAVNLGGFADLKKAGFAVKTP